ncbi:hypothetical protein V8G54_033934 [Vigna mungo]|uniref:Uncharacterized protein n=1 Tax=Vigna mungo TaxID=3915 RepID=A0AAQ3MP74_VIGMU
MSAVRSHTCQPSAAAKQGNPESENQIRWQPGNGRPFVLEAVFKNSDHHFISDHKLPFRFNTPGVKPFHPNRSVFKSEQFGRSVDLSLSTFRSITKVVFDEQVHPRSDSILIFRDYATSSRGGRSFSLRVFLYRGGSIGLTSGGGLLSVSQPGPPGCREWRAYRVIPFEHCRGNSRRIIGRSINKLSNLWKYCRRAMLDRPVLSLDLYLLIISR